MRRLWLFLSQLVLLAGCGPAQIGQPNVLLIVADDLGYTDLGAFGGEIRTPNLDALAMRGIRLTNFHAGPSCAPTRAMLITGTDNHLAGMGSQGSLTTPQQRASRNYQNALKAELPTIAELMRDAGYYTMASAKWHLGDGEVSPDKKGFQRSFVLMPAGSSHFDERPMFSSYSADWREDGLPFTLPDDFYSTDTMTDKLLAFLDDTPTDKPFFAYLGYTAPHWPLQAPAESIARYEGVYQDGWDILRDERMAGAKRAGVVSDSAEAVVTESGVVPWDALSETERARQARIMQVYAGMVDRIDENVGRILRYLETTGQLKNTVIVFMSDNGAEGHQMDKFRDNPTWIPANFSSADELIGSKDSYVVLGPSWARAHTAPFRQTKGRLAEGGIRVPAFVTFPSRPGQSDVKGKVDKAYMRVMDLAPSFLELAGSEAPETMMGRSLVERWRGGVEPYSNSEIIAAEVYGRRLAQKGEWKALYQDPPLGTGDWQLYNLARDPGEQDDLSAEFPQLRAELIAGWEAYAREVGVILPEVPIGY